MTSRGDERLHWSAGAFFSDLHSLWQEYGANAFFAVPENPTGIVYTSNNPYRMDQYALFADGSFKITEAWKFSTGLRWYRYQSSQYQQEWGADGPFGPAIPPRSRTTADNNGYNPRFNLSYSPNVDLTTYAQVAKGFRPGGANQILPTPNTPPLNCSNTSPLSFASDSVWNYELGEKAKMFDNWLTINSDVYYIKWSNIQQTLLISCGYEYEANAGNGRSYGPELEINAKLSEEWFVSGSYTYTECARDVTQRDVHVFPDQDRDESQRDPVLRDGQRLHRTDLERAQGDGDSRRGVHDQGSQRLSADGPRGRQLCRTRLRRGLLLRIPLILVQHRQRALRAVHRPVGGQFIHR